MKYANIDINNKLLGWYSDDIHTEIPTPNIEVTDEQWQEALNVNTNFYDGTNFVFKDFRTPEEIQSSLNVSSITNSQLRQQLLAMGVYEEVDNAITNGTNTALKIKWEYDQNFLISDADLIAMYEMLQRTETLQELFNEASKL